MAEPNPAVLPVPNPKALCFKLGSVEDCQTGASNGAPVGVPFVVQLKYLPDGTVVSPGSVVPAS